MLTFSYAAVRHFFVLQNSVPESTKIQKAASTVQTGSFVIDVGNRDVLNVFYPKPFKSPPFLKVQCVSGGIGLRIKNQRSDGFLLETYGDSWGSNAGITLAWEAQGQAD